MSGELEPEVQVASPDVVVAEAVANTWGRPGLRYHADHLLEPVGSRFVLLDEFSGSTFQDISDLLEWELIERGDNPFKFMAPGFVYYEADVSDAEVFAVCERTSLPVLDALLEYGRTVLFDYDSKRNEYTAWCVRDSAVVESCDFITIGIGPDDEGPGHTDKPIIHFVVAGTPATKQTESSFMDMSAQFKKINCVMRIAEE